LSRETGSFLFQTPPDAHALLAWIAQSGFYATHAAICHSAPTASASEEDWDRALTLDLKAVLLCSPRACYCVGSSSNVDGGWLKTID